jgi:hypothetical protein
MMGNVEIALHHSTPESASTRRNVERGHIVRR